MVGGRLPDDNPYGRELRRYVEEEAPIMLRKNPPPDDPQLGVRDVQVLRAER